MIILARGGGARSDLAVWDSPAVAEAVVTCPVAVWSALGHATDRTVADAVAHRSFPDSFGRCRSRGANAARRR